MNKPRLLDLFCGAGGAAMGYHRAGFEVVGVDIKPQPRYPFEFHQGDALSILTDLIRMQAGGGLQFDAIHASPPCQRYTKAARIHESAGRHPDLVAAVRCALVAAGTPWVIENVVGAPLLNPLMLCGTMFDLRVFRHRLFESSELLFAMPHVKHNGSTGATDGYSTLARGRNGYICVAGHNFIRSEGAQAMGIDWMANRYELSQAVPPAFTEFIGAQLIRSLQAVA